MGRVTFFGVIGITQCKDNAFCIHGPWEGQGKLYLSLLPLAGRGASLPLAHRGGGEAEVDGGDAVGGDPEQE